MRCYKRENVVEARKKTPPMADWQREWIEKTAERLVREQSIEGIVLGIKNIADAFPYDDRAGFALVAHWIACQVIMPSREWRQLFMTLPIESRGAIMSANVDSFLERMKKSTGGES